MYQYQPYPKCLFHADGRTMIAANEDEAIALADEGFLTADELDAEKAPKTDPDPEEEEEDDTPEAEGTTEAAPGAPKRRPKKATPTKKAK